MATLQDIAVAVARVEERQLAQGKLLAELNDALPAAVKRVDALEQLNKRLFFGAGAVLVTLLTLGKVSPEIMISILQALFS